MIESYKADAASYFALFEETMDNLTPEIQDQYRLVRSKIDRWYESSAEDINLVKEGKTEEAINELVTNSKFVADEVEDNLRILIEMMETTSDDKDLELNTQLMALTILQVVVMVVAILKIGRAHV